MIGKLVEFPEQGTNGMMHALLAATAKDEDSRLDGIALNRFEAYVVGTCLGAALVGLGISLMEHAL